MTKIILGIIGSVETHGVDIEILFVVVWSVNDQTVAVLKMKCGFLEQRSTYDIFVRSRTNRVES